MVWAIALSLATTDAIDFSFFSSGYLDVSVPHVGRPPLCIHDGLIRESRDHHLFVNSPELFADFHALHRLLMPRHPPCALSSLVHINPTFFRCTPSRNKSRNVPRLKTRIVRGFRTTDPVRVLQAKHAAEKE